MRERSNGWGVVVSGWGGVGGERERLNERARDGTRDWEHTVLAWPVPWRHKHVSCGMVRCMPKSCPPNLAVIDTELPSKIFNFHFSISTIHRTFFFTQAQAVSKICKKKWILSREKKSKFFNYWISWPWRERVAPVFWIS